VLIEEIYDKAKNINIVEKELDLDLFFNDDNYRKIAIDYYNLIKSTFNILDVLSSLKHFNSMFKSFHTVDTVITSKTNKHYFNSINNSKKIIEKILDIYPQNELYYKITKHIILNGVQNNPVTYSSEILNKINDYYDN
jgi:hypothetical protein